MLSDKRCIFIVTVMVAMLAAIFVFLQGNYNAHHRPPNIMIIIIDALRPDHLGCYGYERDTSPNIDSLAKQGVRFSEAVSAAGWTAESVPSMLTGAYPIVHQIRTWNGIKNPLVETLAQKLKLKGYICMFWTNHGSMLAIDIKAGFQEVHIEGGPEKDMTSDAYELTHKIIARLAVVKKEAPFFLYIHYHGTHIPYSLPQYYRRMYLQDKYRKKPEYAPIATYSPGDEKGEGEGYIPSIMVENNITDVNYYIAQYDGAISYYDAQIGLLMHSLKNLGMDKNTLIILAADHGEMLGEHNVYFSHTSYDGGYEENMRVPLIIKFSKLLPRGKVVSRQVSLIDIAPTIFDIIGLHKPEYMSGESLTAFFSLFKAYSKKYQLCFFRTGEWVALRGKQWKLIHSYRSNSWKLYNLKADPKESHNLVNSNPADFKRLKNVLENLINKITPLSAAKIGPELTEEQKARLMSLGYAQ
ncbi:MAG: sulfatase [Candidatus Omnitrophota bacterium]|nr:sulfatase [Candidatus Omnitrophota bacterium]